MPPERVECTFVEKEGGDNQPYIVVEPTIAGVDISFGLRGEPTIDEARDLAWYIGQRIVSISVTVAR